MTQSAPIRVLYVWDADYPWDVRVEKMCSALSRGGMDVHILARNRRGLQPVEIVSEGTVHRMPAWSRMNDLSGFPAPVNPRWIAHARRTAQRVQPDIVIGRDIPLSLLALQTARGQRVPLILDIAEHYPEMVRAVRRAGRQKRFDAIVRNPLILEVLEKRVIRAADHIVVVVEEMADRYAEMGVPRNRLSVVSNTPPMARILETPERPHEKAGTATRFVYLGLLEQPRGIATFIDAIARSRESGADVRASVIGSGREEQMFRERAANLGLSPEILTFHGFLPYADALEIVSAADVGVIPHYANESWNHTIPNKLFDYMAASLPVLTSDARPAARIVKETGAGLVFESQNPASMAEAMVRLTDPELRSTCGKAGRAAVLERYNFEYDARDLIAVVERLTRGKAGRTDAKTGHR